LASPFAQVLSAYRVKGNKV